MSLGISDTCRDHRHLTICRKQHRQNEPAGQVDVHSRVDIHVTGNLDMCRDHKHLTTCQKQHRQNESAGQLEIPARVEFRMMSLHLSKITQTE